MARVCAGDTDAYAHLVRRHAPMAVRTAALLGAGADAEDVVQEAFVKAYAALGSVRPGAPFRPWFLRIVANETRNLHRGAGRRSAREHRAWLRTEPLVLARPDDPADAVLAAERQAVIVRGLAGLSGPARGGDVPLPARPRRGGDSGRARLAPRDRQVAAPRALRRLQAGLDDVPDAARDGADAP